MANIVDSFSKLPKWAVLAVGGGLIALLGFAFYWFMFGSKKTEEPIPEQILIDMPDAPQDNFDLNATKAFERSKGGNRVADYWDSLGEEDEGMGAGGAMLSESDLDPNVYSELERYYILNGLKTKEEIDNEHAAAQARRAAVLEAHERKEEPKRLTQAQQDSLYFARYEKAMQLAAKYSNVGQAAPEPEPEPEPEERKLDLEEEQSVLPTDSFDGDGIVTSLDFPSDNNIVHYGKKNKPVKATFLKNEKLVNGNRVIIRLMQDFVLSDGTKIPANTHITGTCEFSRRLKINVSMLHYGGRMFPVDISVYDNDGTEGIYCPTVVEADSKLQKAKKVAGDVVQSAGSIAGTLITGNPFIGRVATSGIHAATSSIGSDGTVSVSVSAGYEFYVYENVKEERR